MSDRKELRWTRAGALFLADHNDRHSGFGELGDATRGVGNSRIPDDVEYRAAGMGGKVVVNFLALFAEGHKFVRRRRTIGRLAVR